MKVIICVIIIAFSNLCEIFADPEPYLKKGDTVIVKIDSLYGPLTTHMMAEKQTLYSLSRFYGLKVLDLYECNPMLKDQVVGIDDQIMIPIDRNTVFYDTEVDQSQAWIPVSYEVRAKDNLFRIARVYFNTSIENIKELNHRSGINLQVGDLLQVGWIHIGGIDHQEIEFEETPVEDELIEMENDFNEIDAEEESLVYRVEKGIAMWNSSLSNITELYALHREAPINSVVEIINPFLGKKVFAKVISQLPPNIYPDDVKLVVSPGVANLLGAVDSRFYIKVRYLVPQ